MVKQGLRRRFQKGNSEANPYDRARVLLSPIHASLFELLEQALADRYRVFGNVRLTDVVEVKADLSPKQRLAALERLPASRIDFVVCEKQNTFILGAVMVDEYETEPDAARVHRETAIDRFLATVGIPVVRLSSNRDYSIEDIRIEMSRALFLKWKDRASAPGMVGAENPVEKSDSPYGVCPTCGLPFVKRRARKGTYAGKFFLTCSNYPECKNMRLIKDNSALLAVKNQSAQGCINQP
jgi:hypothetical protein